MVTIDGHIDTIEPNPCDPAQSMLKTMKTKKVSGVEFGRLGGNATFKKVGKKGMRNLGKLGAQARWGKTKTI